MFMNRDYKAVLFGYGTMGERHRDFFERSGVRFVKIFDLEDLDGAENVKASLVEEFISNEKIDFAVVASPATTHYQYVKLCLERKVSVFVEKPLAITVTLRKNWLLWRLAIMLFFLWRNRNVSIRCFLISVSI